MKFKILVVTNHLKGEYKRHFEALKTYMEYRMPYEVEFSFEESDFDVEFTSFGVRKMLNNQYIDMWGTKNAKDEIRKMDIAPQYLYHAVIFVYNIEETGFLQSGKNIGHWTYFNQIVPGSEFVEIAMTKAWIENDDLFRVLTHEIYHVLHFRAKRFGIALEDTMDKYDAEFDVYAPNGNRNRNLAVLKPYLESIAKQPSLTRYINALSDVITALQETIHNMRTPETKRKTIEEFASAIKQYEGWYVGSRSYRNNNPGNLRYGKYQIGTDSGNFSIFKSYDDGWKSLLFQLQIAIDGRSKYYRPEMNLVEFFEVYAPSSDNNYPKKYAQFVADKLGVTLDMSLEDIF